MSNSTTTGCDRMTEEAYFGADDKLIEIDGIARKAYGYVTDSNYDPDFTWYYNGAGVMITPENMPKRSDTTEEGKEEPDIVQLKSL